MRERLRLDVADQRVVAALEVVADRRDVLAQPLHLPQPGQQPADPRGGYGVVGLCVAELLAANPGDEVIITTLAGDLFVYDASLSTRLFRTHVPGSLGAHNAIRVLDLDDDGSPELYVGGSLGLWRFTVP